MGAKMSLEKTTSGGYTPAWAAASRGRTDVLSKLHHLGVDCDIPASNGQTPLSAAAQGGFPLAVRLLASFGCRGDAREFEQGATPAFFAAGLGRTEAVEALFQAGADLNEGNLQGVSPAHAAAFNGHSDTVRALLNSGADVFCRVGQDGSSDGDNAAGPTPFQLALKNKHVDCASFLAACICDTGGNIEPHEQSELDTLRQGFASNGNSGVDSFRQQPKSRFTCSAGHNEKGSQLTLVLERYCFRTSERWEKDEGVSQIYSGRPFRDPSKSPPGAIENREDYDSVAPSATSLFLAKQMHDHFAGGTLALPKSAVVGIVV